MGSGRLRFRGVSGLSSLLAGCQGGVWATRTGSDRRFTPVRWSERGGRRPCASRAHSLVCLTCLGVWVHSVCFEPGRVVVTVVLKLHVRVVREQSLFDLRRVSGASRGGRDLSRMTGEIISLFDVGQPPPDPATGQPQAMALAAPAGWPAPPETAAYHGLPGAIVAKIAPNTEADPVAILTPAARRVWRADRPRRSEQPQRSKAKRRQVSHRPHNSRRTGAQSSCVLSASQPRQMFDH